MRNPLIKQAALALAGIFASVMFAGATAWANEAEQTEKKDAVALGQITVTARKKAENVQKVPVSMDVATQEDLDQAGIRDLAELIPHTSNVYLSAGTPENKVVIRGITTFNSSLYSPAGFYVDDIPFPLMAMQQYNFMDVDRVEVLKGPQGTLFGRNSSSGLIHVITHQPGNELRANLKGEYAEYNTYRLTGNVSGPLVKDRFYAGLSLQKWDSDGFIENKAFNDEKASDKDQFSGRLTLRWTPSERWDIQAVSYGFQARDGYGMYRFSDGAYATEPYTINQRIKDQYIDQDTFMQSVKTSYSGNSVDVLMVAGFVDYSMNARMDGDVGVSSSCASYIDQSDKQGSVELRVSSKDDGSPFSWLLGAAAFSEDSDYTFLTKALSGALWYSQNTQVDTTSAALFGQVGYTLFERLHLNAGIRFDSQNHSGTLKDAVSGGRYEDDLDFNEILPRLSISYDLLPQMMVYASASRGYMSGGFNTYANLYYEDVDKVFDPEYTWNYEVGLKSTWFDGRLLANLALFYIDISDKQVSEIHPQYNVGQTRNAASAHSMGLELELQARPVQGLELSAGLGLNETEIDDWKDLAFNSETNTYEPYDYSGKTMPNAPAYTGSLSAMYRHPLGLMARADWLLTGKFYGDPKNTTEQEAYQILNLRLGYESEHLDLILWGSNVFDKQYTTYVSTYGTYGTVVRDGEPRTIGVTLSYRF